MSEMSEILQVFLLLLLSPNGHGIGPIKDDCRDISSTCAVATLLCKNPFVPTVLKQLCRKSCGLCEPLCEDTSKECRTALQHYLCRTPLAFQCEKSCGLCKNPTSKRLFTPTGSSQPVTVVTTVSAIDPTTEEGSNAAAVETPSATLIIETTTIDLFK